MNDEERERINNALAALPPTCLRAFILVRYEGLSIADAARRLKMKPDDVWPLVWRAFEHCKTIYAKP